MSQSSSPTRDDMLQRQRLALLDFHQTRAARGARQAAARAAKREAPLPPHPVTSRP